MLRIVLGVWLMLFFVLPAESISIPQRILPLAPNLVEIVFALGAGDRVVGRPQFAEWPKEASALPSIGSYIRPELERIVALQPDLCLAIEDGTPTETVRRLRDMGIAVLILNPHSLDSLAETLLIAGRAVGCEAQANALAQTIAARLQEMDARVVRSLRHAGRRPVWLLQIQEAPLMLAGPESYPGQLIQRAGGQIPLAGGGLYPRLSVESVVSLKPDVLCLVTMGTTEHRDPRDSLWYRWPQIPAVRDDRVFVMDSDRMTRPSLRSLDALEMLVTLLEAWAFEKDSPTQ